MSFPVSVVIPLAPHERAWQELVQMLKLPPDSEIILAHGRQTLDISPFENRLEHPLVPIAGGAGRAAQMNAGAEAAQHEWLWFLHADSRLADNTLQALNRTVGGNLDGLFFFDLEFLCDGPGAMRWNQMAVRWRSRIFKIPFGDQGFLIKRSVFHAVGGYREDVSYGEDHVFVWKVRQEGFPVLPTCGGLLTSARKYRRGGWLNVTLLHVRRTIVQAVPNWLLLQKRRVGRFFS